MKTSATIRLDFGTTKLDLHYAEGYAEFYSPELRYGSEVIQATRGAWPCSVPQLDSLLLGAQRVGIPFGAL